mgnify:CR=1 FL=1
MYTTQTSSQLTHIIRTLDRYKKGSLVQRTLLFLSILYNQLTQNVQAKQPLKLRVLAITKKRKRTIQFTKYPKGTTALGKKIR